MPTFSKASQKIMATVHPDIQRVFTEVIKVWDCKPTAGFRTVKEQQALYAQGRTKPGPVVTNCDGVVKLSDHQKTVILAGKAYGLALDIMPYPVDYSDKEGAYGFGGFVLGVAYMMGIPLHWGADWDSDHNFHDQTLYDTPHFWLEIND